MYSGAGSSARANNEFSQEFTVDVGVQHPSLLSPLLFTIVMETLYQNNRGG